MRPSLPFPARRRPVARAFVAVIAAALASPAHANDGRNRYEASVPTELVHLHAPVSAQAGFRVLAADMPGGADGDPAFRWATRPAVALVRLASRRTVAAFGTGPYPLAIFDLSSENGDTPIEFHADGPHGRHPGGSHDGGANLDLGYYLTSEHGRYETPDPAACTDHFRSAAHAGADAGAASAPAAPPVDDRMCHGPADRLDVDRQTLFLLEITRIHTARFGGELLEAIGIDAQVRLAVVARAQAWARTHRFGTTPARVAEMTRLFASSPYDGWAHTHHHHVHVRLLPMDPGAHHAADIAALVADDRALEARLLAQADAAPGVAADGCALLAELSSTALSRSLDLRIAGSGGNGNDAHAARDARDACTPRVRTLRLRVDGGPWETPEDPLAPTHHVLDAPAGPGFSTLRAEAELTFADGHQRVLRRTVALPAQPAWLRVSVAPSHFTGRVQRDGDELLLALDYPAVDAVLVDHVAFIVHRRGEAAPQRVPASGGTLPVASGALPAAARVRDAAGVTAVEAEVGLSGRVRWTVPVMVARPAADR